MMKLGKMWSRVGVCALAAVFGLLLAGCHSGKSSEYAELPGVTGSDNAPPSYGDVVGLRPGTQPGPASAQPGAGSPGAASTATATNPESAETLEPGDTISVSVSDIPNPIPPMEQTIKGDGTITLWFSKTFHVAGKSRGRVEREIHDVYVPAYFVNATFTVSHQAASRFYYVGGEVKAPGRQLWIGPISVTRAIQSAGDFTDFANKKNVQLIHSNGKTEVINCKKALEHPELDVQVYPGDKIHVKRRFW
jgi:polysaccharide biosynthesis/export protein VpsN